MGAWGEKNFENDSAYSWMSIDGEKVTHQRLLSILEMVSPEIYDVDTEASALAAAEIVAARNGKPSTDFPGHVIDFSKVQLTEALKKAASRAVQIIMRQSELYDLFVTEGDNQSWLKIQEDLLERLK